MKILFTGRPNKGSWQIRAVQMAHGLGQCIPFASIDQCKKADFIVVVKRTPNEVIQAIRASGKPWAWDFVDAYPQPVCAAWSKDDAVHWVRRQIAALNPTVVCWPTLRMQEDMGRGGVTIHHHHRPGIAKNPIRKKFETIGYEGAPAYLAHWSKALHETARKLGATFIDRIVKITECDVVVALRGGHADCYVTRHWKSNVKLANAQGSGTPFVGQPDSGYRETMTGAEKWIEEPNRLMEVLEPMVSYHERARISSALMVRPITLEDCQKKWLEVARAYA